MKHESNVAPQKVNPLRDVDFDVNDPNGWYRYAFLRTVYSCGLRLSEALHIRPGDIDRAAGLLHVRQGKGAKVLRCRAHANNWL